MSNRKKVKNGLLIKAEVSGYKFEVYTDKVAVSKGFGKYEFNLGTTEYNLYAEIVNSYLNAPTQEDKEEAKVALITLAGTAFSVLLYHKDEKFIKYVLQYFADELNKPLVEETEHFGKEEYDRLVEKQNKDKEII